MWIIVGILEHAHALSDLLTVVESNAAIGKVPDGYLYPALFLTSEIPKDLVDALANKSNQNRKISNSINLI